MFFRVAYDVIDKQVNINSAFLGKLPGWLSGTVIRVGPGKFEYGDDKMQHWFDGHGIIHRFNIRSGEVSFQSK